MPLFDFICEDDHIEERFFKMGTVVSELILTCECGKVMKWKPTCQFQGEFKPFTHEHLAQNPVEITSRRDYADKCRQYGVYGPYNDAERARNRTEI